MPENDHDLLLRVSEQLKALDNKFTTFMQTSQQAILDQKNDLIEVKKQQHEDIVRLETEIAMLKSDTIDKIKTDITLAKGAIYFVYFLIAVVGVLVAFF